MVGGNYEEWGTIYEASMFRASLTRNVGLLAAWVSEPAKPAPTRDEATLKAYLSWLGEPGEMAAMFRKLSERHEEQLGRRLETGVFRADTVRELCRAETGNRLRARERRVAPMGRGEIGEFRRVKTGEPL